MYDNNYHILIKSVIKWVMVGEYTYLVYLSTMSSIFLGRSRLIQINIVSITIK